MACLHCLIHDALAEHFGGENARLEDGRVPIVPSEALSALAQVAADIVGSAEGDQPKLTAFVFLMEAIGRHLDAHGMSVSSTFAVAADEAPAGRMH